MAALEHPTATTTPAGETNAPQPPLPAAPQPLLVALGNSYTDPSADHFSSLLQVLSGALQPLNDSLTGVTILYPGSHDTETSEQQGFFLQPSPPSIGSGITVQTAATWLRLYESMRTNNIPAGILLGADAQTLAPETLGGLAEVVLRRRIDLAVPRYALPQNQALLNQAVLAPLTRALFGGKVRFPLPLDCAFSFRMAERMSTAAHRVAASTQADAILWPVNEASVAGYDLAEVGNSPREIPPTPAELSQILRDVAGSLFSDIEAKATFWQRTRTLKGTLRIDTVLSSCVADAAFADDEAIDDLVSSFRIGYNNLHDIWSLVLPPQTLVSLKRLSQSPRESFKLADSIWVRIVYDFVLAHRLRTISRSHLLGALTPLYLAWVASHLLALRSGTASRPGQLGRAFEADRPYLVSRWRWPDRFNP